MAAAAGTASAAAIFNWSFETPSVGSYEYDPTGAGWTFAANTGIVANGGLSSVTAEDGNQYAWIQTLNGQTVGEDSISEDITALSVGTEYYLTFWDSLRQAGIVGDTYSVTVGSNNLGLFLPTTVGFSEETTVSFVAASTSMLLTFANAVTGPFPGNESDTLLDNVQIQEGTGADTPEPGSVLLSLGGLGALAALRRRSSQPAA